MFSVSVRMRPMRPLIGRAIRESRAFSFQGSASIESSSHERHLSVDACFQRLDPFLKVRMEKVIYKSHGIEHYHKAVLVLLDRKGGSFKLDGSKSIQREFLKLIEPLLTDEDYLPFKTLAEERWENRFRWALKHMRQDGRVKHFKLAHEYQITDSGKSNLEITALPTELLTEEVEFLDNGEVSVRYVRSDGTVDFEFRGSVDRDSNEDFI
jgi:hypothetical protein